jgi:Family of unknown function (DUF6049)
MTLRHRLGRSFLLLFLLTVISPLPITSAHASSTVILASPSNRTLDGRYIDDSIADSLLPNGKLGSLIFLPSQQRQTWLIDAQLIDEIQGMVKGYTLVTGKSGLGAQAAQSWLDQLRKVTTGEQIVALPYGNPSGYWIHKLDPHDQSFFLSFGATELSQFFNRPIAAPTGFLNSSPYSLPDYATQPFIDMQKALSVVGKYMDPKELETYQLRSADIFSLDIPRVRCDYLTHDLEVTTYNLIGRIHLATGKFTITSRRQNLPITVVNDFPSPAHLLLQIEPGNSRIIVHSKPELTVNGHSKVQVLIPVEVIASGPSELDISILDPAKNQLGDTAVYPVNLRVFSPVATWITGGAAILLFIGVVIQSIRRMRKTSGRGNE